MKTVKLKGKYTVKDVTSSVINVKKHSTAQTVLVDTNKFMTVKKKSTALNVINVKKHSTAQTVLIDTNMTVK